VHDDPLLPVLASGPKLARGWPKYEVGARVTYAPLSELLTTRWAGDAHFCAYSVPRIERRLVTSPPAYERIGGGVPMLVLILDLDCAAAHKAQGGTEGVRADDAWWSVERTRIARIQRAHPGGVWYRTRGGARGVQEPMGLREHRLGLAELGGGRALLPRIRLRVLRSRTGASSERVVSELGEPREDTRAVAVAPPPTEVYLPTHGGGFSGLDARKEALGRLDGVERLHGAVHPEHGVEDHLRLGALAHDRALPGSEVLPVLLAHGAPASHLAANLGRG